MPSYTDFHSHWNGVLPTDELLKLLLAKVDLTPSKSEGEALKLTALTPEQRLAWTNGRHNERTEAALFLRVLCGMLGGDLMPVKQKEAGDQPFRGAHVAMFAIAYVWWCSLRAGLELPTLPTVPPRPTAPPSPDAPQEYAHLHAATLTLLGKLCRGFQERQKEVVAIVERMAPLALRELMCASPVAPFDDAYVARGAALDMLPPKAGMDAFNLRTVEFLGQEHIVYVQMSHGLKKIAQAQEALVKYNDAHKSSPVMIHWLLLFASHRAWLEGKPSTLDYKKELDDAVKFLKVHTQRIKLGHVVGIDLAGPEGYAYGEARSKELVAYTLGKLHDLALHLGQDLVFRPHVGEGCALLSKAFALAETEPYVIVDLVRTLFVSIGDIKEAPAREKQLAETDEYLVTYVLMHAADAMHVTADARPAKSPTTPMRWEDSGARALANVSAFLAGIEECAKKADPRNDWRHRVRIRFGHATHVSADHIARMGKLGIAADCNLGSNLRTGAIALKGKSLVDIRALELKRYASAGQKAYNWDVSQLRAEHPLQAMLLAKAPVVAVLGTDGQGVEVTEVAQEYKMAREVLGAFGDFPRLSVANAVDQVIGESFKLRVREALERNGGRF